MKKVIPLLILLLNLTFAQSLVKTIPLPNNTFFNNGYGMIAKGGYLYISSSSSTTGIGNKLYAVDTSGAIKDSVIFNKTHITESQGLAWDGNYFWFVKRYTALSRIFKITTSGDVIDSVNFPLSGYYPGGAAYENGGLWVSIYYPNDKASLLKYNLSTNQVVDTIRVFGKQPQGIAIKGDTLFYVMDGFDGDLEKIYAVSLITKDTLFSFKVPEQPGVRQNPRGLAWDGRYLYLLAEPVGASSGRAIFQYDLTKSGTPSINLITKNIAFGNYYIDSTLSASLFIQNQGDGKLRIDSAKISNSDFTILPSNFPMEINPNVTYEFTIKFKPTRFGSYNDSVTFYHNDISTTFKVCKLTGFGIYTNQFIACNDQIYNYGQKKNKSTSLKDFIIENRGAKPLKIYSVNLRPPFYRDGLTMFNPLPDTITIDSLSSYKLRVWFKPVNLGSYSDSIEFQSNSFPNNKYSIKVSGQSITRIDTLGSIRWQTMIPANPSTSYQDYSAASIKWIPDVTGDGKADIVLDAENYQLLCYNGNSSGTADLVWRFNHGYNNNNTGKVERVQALQTRPDIDGDGLPEVVVGLGGGNEFVYCVSGRTGKKLWEFGDSINYNNGDVNGIDCRRDFNNDGIPDVLVTTSGDGQGNGRMSVYCLNGLNGNILWQIIEAYPPMFVSGIISLPTGGAYSCYSGTNGPPYYVKGFNNSGTITWTRNTNAAVWSLVEVPDIGGSTAKDVVAADFQGYMYGFSGDNGTLLWQQYVLGPFFTDLRTIPDVNGNGSDEVFGAGTDPNIILIDSKTGLPIWSNNTGSISLGVSEIPDLNNDGYNEVGAVFLGNNVKVINGKTGLTMFEYMMGSGANGTAAEKISYLPDVDEDGYAEFVASARDGKLICFSGGTPSQSQQDSIKITSPIGGEIWSINSTQNITWIASAGVSKVKIEFSSDAGLTFTTIADSINAATGSYLWNVPNIISNLCKIRISKVGVPSVFSTTPNLFTISTMLCKSFNVNAGWNIVSVPVVASNMSKNSLFPTALSNAYGYQEGYITFDTLSNGKAFWLRFGQNQTINICGNSVNQNTIGVKAGWNLIGAYDKNIPVNQIASNPPNIIMSNFFEYNDAYLVANTLNSGKGYWVRVSANGSLVLPQVLQKSSPDEQKDIKLLTITDNSDKVFNLFFVDDNELIKYELPPAPPVKMKSVQFESNRLAENLIQEPKEIVLENLDYPVRITTTCQGINLKDKINGSIINRNLTSGEEIIIQDSRVNKLQVSLINVPLTFNLYQNYPNPFNPVTKIKYDLPKHTKVTLKIYDILGREIATLVNMEQDAGSYIIEWPKENIQFASGTYFYELVAGDFRVIKKMIYLK